MATYQIIKSIEADETIDLNGDGSILRDFTYIDDIVSGIFKASEKSLKKGHRIYNLGNENPSRIIDMIRKVEVIAGKKAKIQYLPNNPNDAPVTYADTRLARREIGYRPQTTLDEGLQKTYEWYLEEKAKEKDEKDKKEKKKGYVWALWVLLSILKMLKDIASVLFFHSMKFGFVKYKNRK